MINIRMQNKESVKRLTPKITVVGVGGAGGNAVNNMIGSGLQGCEFVVCNTDAQALEGSLCDARVQLGSTVTGGLGAGAKPEIGRAAAEESLDDVIQYLDGSNMAFITAGMGGGTGTGAAPVVARACRERGILTVGVVTKPFHFEGATRMRMAEEGIREMQEYVDTLIVIPNQNLFRIANERTTFAEAFKMADSVLQSGVRGVTDLMVMPGMINLDFADIRSAMLEMGKAMMGTGEASGERRALEAAEAAINNPLLDDVSMKGARGVIINVTGGYDMTLFEVDEACNRIRDEVDPNANIIFGSTFDERLEGVMRVSVVATGIDAAEQKARFVPGKGHSIINALTGQERRIERALPNTAASGLAAESPAAAEFVSAPVQAAPVQQASVLPAASGGIARGMYIPAAPQRAPFVSEAAARRVSEPAADASAQNEWAAPKAQLYGDSFIPPKPVDAAAVQPQPFHAAVSSPQFAAHNAAAAELAQQQVAASLTAVRPPHGGAEQHVHAAASAVPSLTLKPPVPGATVAQKKRSPSLIERFTGPLWSHSHKDAAEAASETAGGQQQGGAASGGDGAAWQPAARPAVQGSLNIESPGSEAAEDELDIPAFLRRQAN